MVIPGVIGVTAAGGDLVYIVPATTDHRTITGADTMDTTAIAHIANTTM